MARKFVVQVPVADLRRGPGIEFPFDYSHQENRETQLLFGEPVEMLEKKEEWIRVAVPEQLCFQEAKGWYSYVGWVRSSELREVPFFQEAMSVVCHPFVELDGQALSYGTLLPQAASMVGLRSISTPFDRKTLVEEALYFLGAPYLWGGRACPLKGSISSVDCSGLINLLYRAQGILLPRNAYEQHLKGTPVTALKPGDPLYLAKESRVNHVVLKLDDKTFIESPETGKHVRLLTWGTQIWEEGGRIKIFDRLHAYQAYPVTFIKS